MESTAMEREGVIGTVVRGTLQPDDLLTAFFDRLRVLDKYRARGIRRDYAQVFESLPQLRNPEAILCEKESRQIAKDAAECLILLHDALEEHAPEGLFFGAHPGDGSDFGFWPVEWN